MKIISFQFLLKSVGQFWLFLTKHPVAHPILFTVFIAVHIVFYSVHGRFDCETFAFWQIIDLDLLKTRLLESVWYLHSQPPLFNFFLGIVQKWSWGFDRALYHAIYLLLGLSTAFGIFHLQLRFRISIPIALSLTCLCLLSPSWLLYEHWLMYTFPVMAFLTLAGLTLHRYLETKTFRDGTLFFSTLVLLVYLRSIFHLYWAAIVLLILLPAFWSEKKKLLKTAFVPCCLICFLFVKNAYLFGSWSSSTWLGPNLMRMAYIVPNDIFQKAILQKKVSSYVRIHPFVPLDFYKWESGFDPDKTWGVPVLDRQKKLDGDPNFNNGLYVAINRQYQKDAVTLISLAPRPYIELVQHSWRIFCQPAWIYNFFRGQPKEFYSGGLAQWAHWVHGWKVEDCRANMEKMRNQPRRNLFFWLFPGLIAAGILIAANPKRLGFSLSTADRTTLAFCLFTILLVVFCGTFLLRSENYRIRYFLTPYFILLAGLITDRLFRCGYRLGIRLIQKRKAGGKTDMEITPH